MWAQHINILLSKLKFLQCNIQTFQKLRTYLTHIIKYLENNE